MKKTKRLVCVAALLLAAVMLFSACSINYRTVDTSEYIQISEDGYRKITLSIDKMLVDAADVTSYIDNLRYQNKTAIKTSTSTADNYYGGPISLHDVVTLRTMLYDAEGNLVSTDFAINTKETGTTVVLADGVALPIGFPDSLNEGIYKWLEEQLYGDGSDPVQFDKHVIYHNLLGNNATGITALPEILWCTYSSTYGSASGNKATSITPIHFSKYLTGAQGENSYEEAIVRGIKKLIENAASDPSKAPKPGSVININIYPTAKEIPSDKTDSATAVHINYNLDFSDTKTGTSFDEGSIAVTIKGESGFKEGASVLLPAGTYTFPSDATGQYTTAKGDKHDLKGTSCTVYIYFEERTLYDFPEYDEKFIKETAGYASETTELTALRTEYEEHVRKTLQDECDATAKKEAMKKLWQAAVAAASFIKEPTANIEDFVDNELSYYKYLYYDYGYESSGQYADFESFVLAMYSSSGISYSSYEQVENALYEQGKAQALENMLVYHLADALGVRYTDEQFDQLITDFAAKQAADEVAYLREYYTITDKDTDTTKATKQQWLTSYGFSNASQIPDDFITVDDYLEMIDDDDDYREGLLGGFQLDRVIESLYEVNLAGGTLTYKDVDYKK